MSSIVLKINRETKEKAETKYTYKDIDAFSDKYAVSKVDFDTDVSAVKAAVRNIFMWNTGEEILYPKFGNNVRKFLYEPLDDVSKNELGAEIQRSIEDNERRVRVNNIGIQKSKDDDEQSMIKFVISYTVIGSKSPEGTITDTVTITGSGKGGNTKTTFEA